MIELNGVKVPFIPITGNNKQVSNNAIKSADSFNNIFQKELSKIKFSGHALKRLESRNIELNETEISKIQTAVETAKAKGAKDSLVMMNDTAFIVNIPNKTVVTAMNIKEKADNIFTNIDSVVFT